MKPTTTYPAIVGCVLITAREAKKLDQGEVASRVGLSQSTWSRIERGESALTIDQLNVAARVLGLTPSKILMSADQAAKNLRGNGIDVKDTRNDDAIAQGLAVVAFAALCILVAKAVSK